MEQLENGARKMKMDGLEMAYLHVAKRRLGCRCKHLIMGKNNGAVGEWSKEDEDGWTGNGLPARGQASSRVSL